MLTAPVRPPVNHDDPDAVQRLSDRLEGRSLEVRHVTRGVDDAAVPHRSRQRRSVRVWRRLKSGRFVGALHALISE